MIQSYKSNIESMLAPDIHHTNKDSSIHVPNNETNFMLKYGEKDNGNELVLTTYRVFSYTIELSNIVTSRDFAKSVRISHTNNSEYPVRIRVERKPGEIVHKSSGRTTANIRVGVTPTVTLSSWTYDHAHWNPNTGLIDNEMPGVNLVALGVDSATVVSENSNSLFAIDQAYTINQEAEIICKFVWLYGCYRQDYNNASLKEQETIHKNFIFGDLDYPLEYKFMGNNQLYADIRKQIKRGKRKGIQITSWK